MNGVVTAICFLCFVNYRGVFVDSLHCDSHYEVRIGIISSQTTLKGFNSTVQEALEEAYHNNLFPPHFVIKPVILTERDLVTRGNLTLRIFCDKIVAGNFSLLIIAEDFKGLDLVCVAASYLGIPVIDVRPEAGISKKHEKVSIVCCL